MERVRTKDQNSDATSTGTHLEEIVVMQQRAAVFNHARRVANELRRAKKNYCLSADVGHRIGYHAAVYTLLSSDARTKGIEAGNMDLIVYLSEIPCFP